MSSKYLVENTDLLHQLLTSVARMDERLSVFGERQAEMSAQLGEMMPKTNGSGLAHEVDALQARMHSIELRAALIEASGRNLASFVGRWFDLAFRVAATVFAAYVVWRLGIR